MSSAAADPSANAGAPSAAFRALGTALVACCGLTMALQSGVNSTLGHSTGRAFAAVISFATGLASVALFFAVEVTALGRPPPTLDGLRAAPWWSYLGGPLGAFYITVIIVFARAVGAAALSAVFLSSLLACSFAFDLLGAVGFPRRAFSWPRLVGLVLIVGGVALVSLFPGEVLGRKEAGAAAAAEAEAAGVGGGVGAPAELLPAAAAAAGERGGSGSGGGRRSLLQALGRRGPRGPLGLPPPPPLARSYSSVVLPTMA